MSLLLLESLRYAYSLDVTLIRVDCLPQRISSSLHPQEAGIGRPQVEVLIVFVRVVLTPLLLKLKHSIFISPFFTFVQAEVHTLPASLNDSIHMVIGQVASLQRSGSMKPELGHLLSACCFVLHTGEWWAKPRSTLEA